MYLLAYCLKENIEQKEVYTDHYEIIEGDIDYARSKFVDVLEETENIFSAQLCNIVDSTDPQHLDSSDEVSNLQQFILHHHHRYGTSSYSFFTSTPVEDIDHEKLASYLDIDYEPAKGESFEFWPIDSNVITPYVQG